MAEEYTREERLTALLDRAEVIGRIKRTIYHGSPESKRRATGILKDLQAIQGPRTKDFLATVESDIEEARRVRRAREAREADVTWGGMERDPGVTRITFEYDGYTTRLYIWRRCSRPLPQAEATMYIPGDPDVPVRYIPPTDLPGVMADDGPSRILGYIMGMQK